MAAKQYTVALENIYINNVAYGDYIKSFLDELHKRSDKIDTGRMHNLELIIVKMIDPQFLQTFVSQMNAILADGKITSTDIPAIMVIVVNLMNVQLPKMKKLVFTPEDLKEVILVIFDALLDTNLNKLDISDLEKATLNKLISDCFDLILVKLDQSGLFSKIATWITNVLSFKSCKCGQ